MLVDIVDSFVRKKLYLLSFYPFQIVASDLFSWNNQDLVIVVDYYNKYWEIERLYDTKSITIV